MNNKIKTQLISIFFDAIKAVSGKKSVSKALGNADDNFIPNHIVAVGKAAGDMCLGALEVYSADIPALVATKYHHTPDTLKNYKNITIIESAHPTPDENSIEAGRLLVETVNSLDPKDRLLLLVSGGASSIAEHLPSTLSLTEWQTLTKHMLSSGKNIEQINAKRKEISLIKDGRLLAEFSGSQVLICAISDVEGDSISVIGSGIGDPYRCKTKSTVKLIASNRIARVQAQAKADSFGLNVMQNTESLYNDVNVLSAEIGELVRSADKGVYIWGGEPTIILPDNPGNGGRNQSLALLLAKEIQGTQNISILVAGTDGTDGPTDAAGGIVDGSTFQKMPGAQRALEEANAGTYLRECEDIFISGPTGTNVMDLVIAIIE